MIVQSTSVLRSRRTNTLPFESGGWDDAESAGVSTFLVMRLPSWNTRLGCRTVCSPSPCPLPKRREIRCSPLAYPQAATYAEACALTGLDKSGGSYRPKAAMPLVVLFYRGI